MRNMYLVRYINLRYEFVVLGPPSINDATHFLRFLIPPSSSPILLNRLMEECQLLADPPSPQSV